MKKKIIILVGIVLVGILVVDSIVNLPRWNKKAVEAVNGMEKKIKEKHGIEIVDKKARYDDKFLVYRGTFQTKDGVTFEAERAIDGVKITDYYQDAVWEKEAMEKWGNASEHIPYIKEVNVNFDHGASYRVEDEGLSCEDVSIVDVKNIANLSIHVNLDKLYSEDLEQNVKQGMFNYYQWLQENDGEKIVLYVGYIDSVWYQITYDENHGFPTIRSVEDIEKYDFSNL